VEIYYRTISLLPVVREDKSTGTGLTSDPLISDFRVSAELKDSLFCFRGVGLFHGSLFFLAFIIFMLAIPRLLALAVNRIFLLDFITGEIPADRSMMGQYFPDGQFPIADFILDEKGKKCPLDKQEEHILLTSLKYNTCFEEIWGSLPLSERYFLFDFAVDGYTNYKDVVPLYRLLEKGILSCKDNEWTLFSLSFREFVLEKKGSPEIEELKANYSVPGVWATIRIPTLIVIAACAFLLLLTQESISHRVTVMITSVGAIVPVILEITKKVSSRGSA
jgi:hypothetical protein